MRDKGLYIFYSSCVSTALLDTLSFVLEQMNVLNVMSLLIELLGNQMKPFLGTLLQLLPALWDASEEHNLLRCAIISTLVHVVKVRTR